MKRVGILGSNSLVARSLLDGSDAQHEYISFSRSNSEPNHSGAIPHWISLAPIWALPDWFARMEARGVERIVVLSSTSIFTKTGSSDAGERRMVEKLIDAEARIDKWAKDRKIRYTILRPTMIYGRGLDRNVSQIAYFIRRFGFFPLFGAASGLRQPVHVDDVALACRRALETGSSSAYNISGGEKIAYREMVGRIFSALGRRPRYLTLPLWLFRAVTPGVRLLPKFHDWSPSMAQRMNQDLAFDNAQAQTELGIVFRRFEPTLKDLIPDAETANGGR